MGKIDYEMFRSVTKNKFVKSMVTGKVGSKVELSIKELLDIVAVEEWVAGRILVWRFLRM